MFLVKIRVILAVCQIDFLLYTHRTKIIDIKGNFLVQKCRNRFISNYVRKCASGIFHGYLHDWPDFETKCVTEPKKYYISDCATLSRFQLIAFSQVLSDSLNKLLKSQTLRFHVGVLFLKCSSIIFNAGTFQHGNNSSHLHICKANVCGVRHHVRSIKTKSPWGLSIQYVRTYVKCFEKLTFTP